MSIIGCILIAALAHQWKSALIAAFMVGLLGSTIFGFLRWEDTHIYGTTPDIGFMVFYIATGTTAFEAETAAFFGIKLGLNVLLARWRGKDTG